MIIITTKTAVLLVVVIVFLFIMFPIVKVCGVSMYPTYNNGEYIIGRRLLPFEKLEKGRIYVYKPPYVTDKKERYVIKRLHHHVSCNELFFTGDNKNNSYDSRHYGPVDRKRVKVVILRKVTRYE